MVGADVRDDADVVRRVADPAQQDAAASGLEDRDVEPVLREDPGRAAEAGPVPRLDELAAHVDPVGVRHPDLPPGGRADVGDQAGRRALPVRAGDGNDRDARPRQVRERPERGGPQPGDLPLRRRPSEGKPRGRCADRLRDRPAAPWIGDRRPQPVDRLASRQARLPKAELDRQPLDRATGRFRDVRRIARLRPGELELHRRAGEEPIRPIQDPELHAAPRLARGVRPLAAWA